MLRFVSRSARISAGVALSSVAVGVGAFLAGCPQSQIDIDFGDGGASSANDGQVVPPGCDLTKDPKDSPACIDESIALFVAPTGKDTNAGTKAAPLLTIDAALAKADAQHDRVYVCEGTYSENVEVSATATASLFGGFACADWSDTGRVVKISPSKPGYAISILGVASPIKIGDVELDAPNAQGPGDSSIAAFVSNSAGVTFANVVVNAGTAMKGADGTLIEYVYPASNGGNSNSGMTGGAAVTITCPVTSCTTVGGKGGDNGNGGNPGTPQIDGGTGGAGGIFAACGSGGTGSDGDPSPAGSNGDGAKNVGAIDGSGWKPAAGTQGTSGGCGQGGGGGTGESNSGGGSGGAGGCGGASGAPGNGGGGSIGVLIFSSTVAITKSTITTSAAGNGGAGVAGQPGQGGGSHGTRSGACNGGAGGSGGAGGASGGGAGGVSIGVFYNNSKPPTIDADTKFNGPTSGGTKGAGGAPGANDGVDGTAGTTVENK